MGLGHSAMRSLCTNSPASAPLVGFGFVAHGHGHALNMMTNGQPAPPPVIASVAKQSRSAADCFNASLLAMTGWPINLCMTIIAPLERRLRCHECDGRRICGTLTRVLGLGQTSSGGTMGIYRDVFDLAAKVWCLEGYLYEQPEAAPQYLPNWLANIH